MEETETKELTELEKLKAQNEAYEKELLKAQELKAEQQKIEANNTLGGSTGGRVEPKPEKPLTDIEYANKFMRGEANPLKEDDISIN